MESSDIIGFDDNNNVKNEKELRSSYHGKRKKSKKYLEDESKLSLKPIKGEPEEEETVPPPTVETVTVETVTVETVAQERRNADTTNAKGDST